MVTDSLGNPVFPGEMRRAIVQAVQNGTRLWSPTLATYDEADDIADAIIWQLEHMGVM